MKLNLGAGGHELAGFQSVDAKDGQGIYPLAYPDDSAEEIYASHVLEHFSHQHAMAVLSEWVRVLKPGGRIRIAVPDFEQVAKRYLAGEEIQVQGLVMGGQVDEHDYHRCIYDREALTELMEAAGLERIEPWQPEINDCSSYPISLNLAGYKPVFTLAEKPRAKKFGAAMSVPRLGFMDNFFCALAAFPKLGIELRKYSGAFWGQCLERCIEMFIAEGCDYVITVDYDTVYTRQDVATLMRLALEHPEADAIAALQQGRTQGFPLMTIRGEDGRPRPELPIDYFESDLARASTAHFGLTAIKVEALQAMPRPWFWSQPAPDGTWGEGRLDDDVYFWRQWEKQGRTLYVAPRVVVGHAELMVQWPSRDFETIYQHSSEFWKGGKPSDAWE